jgi:WD40 repeat protein
MKGSTQPRLLVIIAMIAQVAAAQVSAPKRIATEKHLGSVAGVNLAKRDPRKPNYWISPDGRRFAYPIDKGVVIDGETIQHGSELKDLRGGAFLFSPDSQRTAYVIRADKGETLVLDGVVDKQGYNFVDCGPVFSPDSKHIAFTARRYVKGDTEYVLLIDGREADVFKNSGSWSMSFTADSRRVIYGVEIDKRHVMRETSIDGSTPTVDHRHGPALMTVGFFFGGGGQLGYIAKDAEAKQFVFYDGKEETLHFNKIMQHNLRLSADGKHLAYTAEPSSFRHVVVLDGKQSREYGGLDGDLVEGSLAQSPDGRRSGYVVKQRNQQVAFIDGKEGKPYRSISGIVFSPDSKRVAYLAAGAGKAMAVVDGQEISGFEKVGESVFSPDSKSVAFWAEAGKRQFLVINGQKQKAYDDVDTPWFSPDGKRLAYLAQASGKTLLVENGKEQKPYDNIKPEVYFSDDSRHLAIVASSGGQQMVVVNNLEGNRYDTIVTTGGAKVHFDSADRFHYLATKGDQLYLVEETLQP